MTPEQMEQAGHYVLGLLSEEERLAFEAKMSTDAVLSSAVAKLQQHFEALDDTATALPANPELWRRIEAGLSSPSGESAAAPIQLPRRKTLRAWPAFAMAASVVMALGIGYMLGSTVGTTARPTMIAVLISETDAGPGAIVEAFADHSVRVISLDDFIVPAGQVLEVWTLPDADTGPVSLGTFTDPSTVRLTGPDLPAPQEGQLYEITVEPSPRSPTGRPTGPILVKGYAKRPV